MNLSSFTRAGAFLAIAAGFVATNASATSIGTGQANIGGTVTVTGTTITFCNTLCTVANIFDAGTSSGSLAGDTGGTIKNLTGGPVVGANSVIDEVTFNTTSGLVHFDLTSVDPGAGNAAACLSNTVGNQCTPTGSPFTITQVTADKVTFSLGLEGNYYLGSSATGVSSGGAIFTGQQTPGTITGILAAVQAGGFTDTYSATFDVAAPATVPEPGTLTMLLTGAGLLGISVFTKRARKIQNRG